MTLKESLEFLKRKFPQQNILIPELDYDAGMMVPKLNPKYLFRGESKLYPCTQSFYERLIVQRQFNQMQWKEIGIVIIELSVHLTNKFHEILQRGVPGRESIFTELSGYMQHYGFPISRIDFTSDINVAAFFAAKESIVGERGKLCVIELSEWVKENRFEKLDKSLAKRPREQNAFSLIINPNNFDFKKSNRVFWIEFEFQKEDSIFSAMKNYLSTADDKVASEIIDYLERELTAISDKNVILFFKNILHGLKSEGKI